MASAGRILIIPKGVYSGDNTYSMLDMVNFSGATWLAKKEVMGVEPSEENSEYWFRLLGHTVANNVTTANAGYVLDARQGKVLMDAIKSNRALCEAEMADEVSRLENIINGRNQAKVFETTEEMNAWLSDITNAGTVSVGSNLYIVDIGVPDWWISKVLEEADAETGFYYKIAQLETQKVDLTTIEEELDKVNESLNVDTANLNENYSLSALLQLLAEKYFYNNLYLFDITNPTSAKWNGYAYRASGNTYGGGTPTVSVSGGSLLIKNPSSQGFGSVFYDEPITSGDKLTIDCTNISIINSNDYIVACLCDSKRDYYNVIDSIAVNITKASTITLDLANALAKTTTGEVYLAFQCFTQNGSVGYGQASFGNIVAE